MTICRRVNNNWKLEPWDPNISLIVPEHFKEPESPVYQFIHKVPKQQRMGVAPYNYLQTKMLQLCAQRKEARQLLAKCPILLWLLAEYLETAEFQWYHIRILLRMKRKEIVRQVFGKGSKADIRMLSKIKFGNQPGTEVALNAIKNAIINDYSYIFRHHNIIPLQLLIILGQDPFLWASRMLPLLTFKIYPNQIELIKEVRKISHLWEDISGIAEALDINPERQLNRCESIESLQNLHYQWIRRLNQRERPKKKNSPDIFPKAPIEGNDKIIQIRETVTLMEEGQEMHHCVGGYVKKIKMGKCFIFKVLQPERATLEIKQTAHGIRIGQFKCAYNKTPSDDSFKVIQEWIDNYMSEKNFMASGPEIEGKFNLRFQLKKRKFLDDLEIPRIFRVPA